jgi:chorismate mutase
MSGRFAQRKIFRQFCPSDMNSSSKPSPSKSDSQPEGGAPVRCRGVRAATTVQNDDRDEILHATRQMLALLIRRNQIDTADIASAQFTVTQDITAEFPALAARQLGWSEVPLLCGYEISVPGSLSRCIRVLLHWNTTKTASEIHHVYLHGAEKLRPDLNRLPEVDFEELEAWINQQMQETE